MKLHQYKNYTIVQRIGASHRRCRTVSYDYFVEKDDKELSYRTSGEHFAYRQSFDTKKKAIEFIDKIESKEIKVSEKSGSNGYVWEDK
jgi:hypothetical protein